MHVIDVFRERLLVQFLRSFFSLMVSAALAILAALPAPRPSATS